MAGIKVNEGTNTPGMTKTDAYCEFIRGKIISGEWKPGDKLPSQSSWASGTAGLKVLYGTYRNGNIILRTQGWIRGHQGDGVYVTDNPPIPKQPAALGKTKKRT